MNSKTLILESFFLNSEVKEKIKIRGDDFSRTI